MKDKIAAIDALSSTIYEATSHMFYRFFLLAFKIKLGLTFRYKKLSNNSAIGLE